MNPAMHYPPAIIFLRAHISLEAALHRTSQVLLVHRCWLGVGHSVSATDPNDQQSWCPTLPTPHLSDNKNSSSVVKHGSLHTPNQDEFKVITANFISPSPWTLCRCLLSLFKLHLKTECLWVSQQIHTLSSRSQLLIWDIIPSPTVGLRSWSFCVKNKNKKPKSNLK